MTEQRTVRLINGQDIMPGTITGSNIASGTITSSNIAPAASGSLAGTTAGTVYYWQFNLGGIKIFVAYFSGYENDTTTNQTITFPIAYTYAPTVIVGNSTLPSLSASTTTLTITAPNSTTTYTGTVLVIGY